MYHSSLHHFEVCGGVVAWRGRVGGIRCYFLGGVLGQTEQTWAESGATRGNIKTSPLSRATLLR